MKSAISFNQKLGVSILAIFIIVTIRLLIAGKHENNWEGVVFSALQLAVVGVTTYFGLRQK